MPATLSIGGRRYALDRELKHDFHGATGIYVAADEAGAAVRAIVKLGRVASFYGLPMRWLGRWLIGRERRIYEALGTMEGVPEYLGPVGPHGLAHEYIDGLPHSLERRNLDGVFFRRLDGILARFHARDLAYNDLSKPENILVGADGRPYLIDFGIAWHFPARRRERRGVWRWLPSSWGRRLLREFQRADRFHMLKHWRRNDPESMDPRDHAASLERRGWTKVHGWVRVPWRSVRRRLRRWFGGASGRI